MHPAINHREEDVTGRLAVGALPLETNASASSTTGRYDRQARQVSTTGRYDQ